MAEISTFLRKCFREGKPTSLYLNSFLRNTALSLVGIFIPLYILSFTKSPFWVLGYYLLSIGMFLVLLLPFTLVVYFLHFRWSVLLSNLFLISEFLFLILAKNNFLFLFPSAIFGALQTIFYWLPYHLIFAEEGAKGGYEEDVGIQAIIGHLSSILPPFLGGVLISQIGFNFLYGVAVFFVFLSALPLFFIPHHKKYRVPFSKRVIVGFKERRYYPNSLSFFGQGIESIVDSVCWPIFLFSVVGSYKGVGGLISGVALLAIIVLTLILKFVPGGVNKTLFIFLGGSVSALIWIWKGLVWNSGGLFVLDSLQEISGLFFGLPFSVLMYNWCWTDSHPFEFILRREIVLHGGRFFALLFLFLLFYLKAPWVGMLSLGALGMILAIYPFRSQLRELKKGF